MSNYPQSLLFTDGWPQAWLRELTGREEMQLVGTDVDGAIGLIDSLLVGGQPQGQSAKHLTAPDRDRVLAAIYRNTYGDRISGTLECIGCGAPFDLDFSLTEYVDHAHAPGSLMQVNRLPGGILELAEGVQLRIPTGEDELAVRNLAPEAAAAALMQRCLISGQEAAASMDLDAKLAEVAPVLETEMGATCPECGHESSVRFDVQGYLLQSLINDRERLTWEVHRLANAYGWRLKDILKLSRTQRKQFARLIEAEMAAG